MRFFLVGRDRDSGGVRLLTDVSYQTRQEAADALGPLVAEGAATAGTDVFVADLEGAIPVVVCFPQGESPSPPVEVEEPMSGAWEASEPAPTSVEDLLAGTYARHLDEGGELAESAGGATGVPAQAVDDGWPSMPVEIPPVPLAAEESEDLAEALRRAAESMEGDASAAPAGMDADQTEAAPTDPAGVATAIGGEEPAVATATDANAAWPWDAPVVEEPAPETTGTPEPAIMHDAGSSDGVEPAASSFEPVGIDAPGLDDISLLTPGGALGEEIQSRTVVMGDYGLAEETAPDVAPGAASWDEVVTAAVAATDDVEAGTDEPGSEDDDVTTPVLEGVVTYSPGLEPGGLDQTESVVDAAGDDATIMEVSAPDVSAVDGTDVGGPGYPGVTDEPGVAGYTCDDCVYVATCPKHHQEGPATCGSFQWKSV